MEKRDHPEIEAVKLLGEQIGYGHLMSIASSLWHEDLAKNFPGAEIGAFVPALISDLHKIRREYYQGHQRNYLDVVRNHPFPPRI